MDTCICMAKSFYYLPKTITILLIGSAPIQNKTFTFKKRERERNSYTIQKNLAVKQVSLQEKLCREL